LSNKRIKVTFETINAGKYTVIRKSEVATINARVGEEMKPVVRNFEKNETLSKQSAGKLVLNA